MSSTEKINENKIDYDTKLVRYRKYSLKNKSPKSSHLPAVGKDKSQNRSNSQKRKMNIQEISTERIEKK
jgi:hypothetical protein